MIFAVKFRHNLPDHGGCNESGISFKVILTVVFINLE